MQDRDLLDQRLTIPNGAAGLKAKLSLVSPGQPLLILAHGFAGNKDENGLFTAARDYFSGCGFSVLRFDFRGCGENDDSFRATRLVDLQSDLEAVVAYARSLITHSRLGLISFSLASAVSILVNPRVKAQVFWSPAIDTNHDMYTRYQTGEILENIRTRGYFVKAGLEVGPQFLEDLKSNQVIASLSKFSCPTLMIHGTADERIAWTSTLAVSRRFPVLKLCRIPDAGHSFKNKPEFRELVFSATAGFFEKQFVKRRVKPQQYCLHDNAEATQPSPASSV